MPEVKKLYTVKLPSAVTLGGAYDEDGRSPVRQQSRDLLP